MEYIEKATKEIRENWFGDHVAEIQGEEGLQVIYWGNLEREVIALNLFFQDITCLFRVILVKQCITLHVQQH